MESLAALPPEQRSWDARAFVSMWVGCTFQPSPFIFGASLLALGVEWGVVAVGVCAGNAILLAPLIANGLPGVAHGIPFPVLLRASFGVRGAQAAALLRAGVAIGWVAFNMWIGASALASGFATVGTHHNATGGAALPPSRGVTLGWFWAFVAVHVGVVLMGLERVRPMLAVVAPVQAAGLVAIVVWALSVASPAEMVAAAEALRPEDCSHPVPVGAGLMIVVTSTCAGCASPPLPYPGTHRE